MNFQGLLSFEQRDTITAVAYLIASVSFVLGLKGLSHPRTAVRGNLIGSFGMFLAVVVTLFNANVLSLEWIGIGAAIGAAIGATLAVRIQMTEMPQMVALFNGTGGAASVLVASAALLDASLDPDNMGLQLVIATVVSALIGCVTFLGSIIGLLKLQGIVVPSGAVTHPALKGANVLVALVCVAAATATVMMPGDMTPFWVLVGASCLLGVTLVVPIGGADMPVVIALLNSYSGLAACATGFVLNNSVLIIAGSLVGASGIILTQIMCKAMNRSLANVLFGGLGAAPDASAIQSADEVYAGRVTSASADEAAMVFDGVRRVVIVPGYGMAVSQAQHAVRELTEVLQDRGAEVLFAIHPVAGRMPGHMNVLLAEADIPYEHLKEMDDINPEFPEIDVALVVGANDVVNPVARTDPTSAIAGMPILDVDRARTVMVVKRSLSPGFAGIPNPLFAADNTMMLFGDGKQMIVDLVSALKEYE